MSKPEVTREEILAWLDRLGKLINFEPSSPDRPFEQALRRLIEKQGEWEKALEHCLYFLPSFNDPRGRVEIDGQMVDIRRHVTHLLAVRDFNFGKEND